MVSSVFSSPVLAEGTVLDACMETFWNMYENKLREEFGAKFDAAECGRERNMPYVVIGVTLTNPGCIYDEPIQSTTNFYVRGPEPKAYLPEYKIEKECSIQGPIACGDEYIVNTTIDIQFEEDGALGKWKKFVKDDICELVMADYAADQAAAECPCFDEFKIGSLFSQLTNQPTPGLFIEDGEYHCIFSNTDGPSGLINPTADPVRNTCSVHVSAEFENEPFKIEPRINITAEEAQACANILITHCN
jgi:hypothetical protein